jgi:hypothetical protein
MNNVSFLNDSYILKLYLTILEGIFKKGVYRPYFKITDQNNDFLCKFSRIFLLKYFGEWKFYVRNSINVKGLTLILIIAGYHAIKL